MTELLLVAATGLAREVMAAVRGTAQFDLLGLLDDDPRRSGTVLDGAHVLGSLADVGRYPTACIVVCASSGSVRCDIVHRLTALGVSQDRFATIVHPRASVPEGCSVGEGSIVLANAVMTAGVRLGRHVVVMPQVTLMQGAAVEDCSTLAAAAVVGESVVVGRTVSVGMNASIRRGVRIGEGAVIGMGAAVVSDVPGSQTWVGVPARQIPPPAATASAPAEEQG